METITVSPIEVLKKKKIKTSSGDQKNLVQQKSLDEKEMENRIHSALGEEARVVKGYDDER